MDRAPGVRCAEVDKTFCPVNDPILPTRGKVFDITDEQQLNIHTLI